VCRVTTAVQEVVGSVDLLSDLVELDLERLRLEGREQLVGREELRVLQCGERPGDEPRTRVAGPCLVEGGLGLEALEPVRAFDPIEHAIGESGARWWVAPHDGVLEEE